MKPITVLTPQTWLARYGQKREDLREEQAAGTDCRDEESAPDDERDEQMAEYRRGAGY